MEGFQEMKGNRLLAFFLSLALAASLLAVPAGAVGFRSEEHTSELQSQR